jgi:transposase-like protein
MAGGFMDVCKYCGSDRIVKNGFIQGIQRYKCRSCGRNPRVGDKRERYDNRTRALAVAMYLNNCGFRSIGRVLDVPFQLVHRWIRHAGDVVEKAVLEHREEPREIAILEMDELYTFIQKNSGKSEYGWLLIGTEMRLLHITSEQVKADTLAY